MKSVQGMIDDLIRREGGYVDHPADRGGPTRWGITEAVARSHGYCGAMRDFPREKAVEIYLERYWLGPGFGGIATLAPRLAEKLFDIGVNMGPVVAVRFLVRALDALGRGQRGHVRIEARDTIDEQIRESLAAFLKRRGVQGESVLLTAVRGMQAERYITLVERRPANAAFLFGWLANRVEPAAA